MLFRSYDYWVTINKVSFPEDFSLDLEYNCRLVGTGSLDCVFDEIEVTHLIKEEK